MSQVLGAFDRRALEFEAMVRDRERRMPRDQALLEACDASMTELEDAEELLARADELRGHGR